jgi:hypothetical protein
VLEESNGGTLQRIKEVGQHFRRQGHADGLAFGGLVADLRAGL